MKEVTIYTDGACSGNPGPGGIGVVLLHAGRKKEIAVGYKHTTNNRMELRAVITGLEALKETCKVTLYSDSQYIIDAMNNGWAIRWRANRWKRNKKDRALNPDLWQRILDLCEQHEVTFIWTRGHNGNFYNERCDVLAVGASQGSTLIIDQKSADEHLL